MILYPKKYFEKITDIDTKFLIKNNIKALILDVDNTLIDIEKNMIEGLEQWICSMKQNGIRFYILSNSNNGNKVKKIAKKIDIDYFYFGMKPLKHGFRKIQKILKIDSKHIGVVGDQIFTDVLGANRCKMFSILVKPISEKDIWITVLKRPIENKIIENYKRKIKENT